MLSPENVLAEEIIETPSEEELAKIEEFKKKGWI